MVEAEIVAIAPVVGVVGDPALEQAVGRLDLRDGIREPYGREAIGMADPGIQRGDDVDQARHLLSLAAHVGPLPAEQLDGLQPVVVGRDGIEAEGRVAGLGRPRDEVLAVVQPGGGVHAGVGEAGHGDEEHECRKLA